MQQPQHNALTIMFVICKIQNGLLQHQSKFVYEEVDDVIKPQK